MSPSPGPVNELCARWRTAIPEIAVARAIADAFPDLADAEPPIALQDFARRRGITDIVTTPLDNDGEIAAIGKGLFAVQLNARQSVARRRFTLAHEIGHTFFFELEEVQGADWLRPRDVDLRRVHAAKDVEHYCNLIASELLMPAKQFSLALQRLGVGAPSLLQLAGLFRVSVQAAARRMVQLAPVKLAVAMWQHRPEHQDCYSLWTAGRIRARDGADRLIVTSRDPVYAVFTSEQRFAQRVWFTLGRSLDKCFVDGVGLHNRSGRRILTVFVLHPNAEYHVGTADLSSPAEPAEPPDQPTFL